MNNLEKGYSSKVDAQLSQPKQSLIYSFISYCLVFPIFRTLFRGRISGYKNVPLKGALVVVANHGSHLDPPLLGNVLGRPVAFMAKEELFRIPLLGSIIHACGAYPVSRGSSDREALRVASKRLSLGWAIGVFLDGTRQANGLVNKPMAGAALLSARSGAPILPVAIINTHRVLGKGRTFPRLLPIYVRIGKLIPPASSRKKADLIDTTNKAKSAINSMIEKGALS